MASLRSMWLQDGHPPLGWHDTAAYLVLPVLLIVSQYVSMEIMKPPQVWNKFILYIIRFFIPTLPVLILSLFFFWKKIVSDRWSKSKEHSSYFQVSSSYDWLLLLVCSIRTNNLLVSISDQFSINRTWTDCSLCSVYPIMNVTALCYGKWLTLF